MNTTTKQKQAMLLMCVCAGMWSLAGLFIKLLPWNPMAVTGWRSLIAAACIGIYMLTAKISIRFTRNSLLSAMYLTLVMFAFVGANKLTSAANAIVLQFTSPVFILLLSAFLYRQRPSRTDMVTVGLTLGGISLFFLDKLDPGGLAGNLLAILAGLFLAMMFLSTGRSSMEDRMSGLFLGQAFAAVIGVPFSFFFETPVTGAAVASILVLGVVQLGVPYILYGHAVQNCPPLACSLLGVIEPLLNPVWVFLVTKEAPGIFALLGGVVVITTITIWCVRRDRTVQAQQALD